MLKPRTVAQKHRRRRNCAERVRQPLTCYVRRRAVHRLIKPDCTAYAGRSEKPERAADGRRLVRENVAEEILRENDIKCAGFHHEMHRAGVNVKMIERHVRVIFRYD